MQPISFVVNTSVNTLDYVKLLLTSLKNNLDSDEHEILIFIDSDNENTLDYLLQTKSLFKDLNIITHTLDMPVGYARNTMVLTEYAKHDIISYLQSDMVIGPHYDTEILRHAKPGRILSSTRIEPPLHGPSTVTITKNLGLTPDEFDIVKWNKFSNEVKREELVNYFFAPFTYYKQDWIDLGGYDTVFRRAREDSDLVQRCVHAGIELVQTFSANVYHFTCVSSRGKNWFNDADKQAKDRVQLQQQADSIELKRFIRKWGNFNHGEKKLFKLDMDLVIKNYELGFVTELEPFFSRVWVASEEHKTVLLEYYNSLHNVANALLDTTPEEWDLRKSLYRLDEFNKIIMVGTPDNYNIKVEIDCTLLKNNNQFLSSITNLYDLLNECEPGEYELDSVKISVNKVEVLPVHISVVNPKFDYNLLKTF